MTNIATLPRWARPDAIEPARRPTVEDGDILWGYLAIGQHLGLTGRQANWRADHGDLPVLTMGRTVCARRSAIAADIGEREAAAKAARVAREAR